MLFVIALLLCLSGHFVKTNENEVNASTQLFNTALNVTESTRADDVTTVGGQTRSNGDTESTQTTSNTERNSEHAAFTLMTDSSRKDNGPKAHRSHEYFLSSLASEFTTKGITSTPKPHDPTDPMTTAVSGGQSATTVRTPQNNSESSVPMATESFTKGNSATETSSKPSRQSTTSVTTDSCVNGNAAKETTSKERENTEDSSASTPSQVDDVSAPHSVSSDNSTGRSPSNSATGTTKLTGDTNAHHTNGLAQTTSAAFHADNTDDLMTSDTTDSYAVLSTPDTTRLKFPFATAVQTTQSTAGEDTWQTSTGKHYNSMKSSTTPTDTSGLTPLEAGPTMKTTDWDEDNSASSSDWTTLSDSTVNAHTYFSSTPDAFSTFDMKAMTTSKEDSSEQVSRSRTPHETTDVTFVESTSSAFVTSPDTSYSHQHSFVPSTSSLHDATETHSPVTDNPTTKESSLPRNINFLDFVSLTTENLTQCFEEDKRLEFHAISGQISFSRKVSNATSQNQKCRITLNLPVGMVADMWISLNMSSCYHMSLMIFSKGVTYPTRLVCPTLNRTIETSRKIVTVQMNYQSRFGQFRYADLFINFTSIPRPRLEVNITSNTTGYIQSPGWDGKSLYPNNVDDWARLDVPANHSVMISFVHLSIEKAPKCRYDRLTIKKETDEAVTSQSPGIVLCGYKTLPRPEVYEANALTFHFVTDFTARYTGFKLLFSFHHESSVPEKTPSGLWNCSVTHWPNFQQHIHVCNLVDDCYAGEDEANCSHLYEGCERGSLSVGRGCYLLMEHGRKITWNEAADECLRQNAHLANLNSPEEWTDVLQFIDMIMENKVEDSTFYLGLQTSGPNFPDLYRKGYRWNDESAVFYFKVRPYSYSQYSTHGCSVYKANYYSYRYPESLQMVRCDQNLTNKFLCEKQPTQLPDTSSEAIRLLPVSRSGNRSHVTCPAGHVVSTFLACDVKSECWTASVESPSSSCDSPVTPQPPSFACNNGVERVPYTLVCDHRPDCSDNSDEYFCFFPPCQRAGKFQCSNKQCILMKERCDRVGQCLDGSDELQCPYYYYYYNRDRFITPGPPVIVNFDRYGFIKVKRLDQTELQSNVTAPSVCPETHFLCPGNWTYCMPVFVRCNGVSDCPGKEDEKGCDSYACPGFYRCRASSICIHPSHVCDGVFQCPQRDDELLCEFNCPENCTCHGLAFFCSGPFPCEEFPEIRFLDGQGSGIVLKDLDTNTMLVSLNVARCGLTSLNRTEFPNLKRLDLSENKIRTIKTEDLETMSKLQVLLLTGNPLTSLFVATPDLSLYFPSLELLDLSEIPISTLNISTLAIFPRLLFLNLSGCGVKRLAGEGLHSLIHLKYLDIKRCPMDEFPKDIFEGLLTLTEVWADNYKLCCPATLPRGFNLINCHSPSDEISSCDALLRSDLYRVILSLFTILALLGNLASFVYRVFVNRVANNLGFGAFVTHLCVSDFLMGMYLAVIGVADQMYMGTYLWKDSMWKRSTACKMAGFMSLLSSEVSAFIICLITLDRFLVLRFPFSRLHFRKRSAHVACGIAWLVGVILAGIPLLPMTSHWEFYSQNGICIPLPITRNDFAGHDYSFVVMIIVNFVLFLLIAAGQMFIYWSVRTNSMTAGDSTKKSKDLTIARRLITIAMSDFLCWFPIGLLGVLASTGVPIPGEVNVAVAIIILPVNSAINPFLYTINMLLERRSRAREKRIQKMVMSAMASKNAETAVDRLNDGNYTKGEALDLMKSWLTGGVVSANNVEDVLMEHKEKTKASKESIK